MTKPKNIIIDEGHKKLLEKLRNLKVNADIFSEAFMNDPRPSWYKLYKDGQFKMIIVNRAFTFKTGISIPAYYMQSDDVMWKAEDSHDFNATDMEAVKKRIRISIEETVTNPSSGKKQVWVGFKTPRFHPKTKEVIGVYGQADVWEEEIWASVPKDIKKAIKLEY